MRSIDTGETHPETSLPILPIPVPYGETIRTTIKLSDLYIAILSKYNGMEGRNLTISQSVTELMIWNWKSGDLVLVLSFYRGLNAPCLPIEAYLAFRFRLHNYIIIYISYSSPCGEQEKREKSNYFAEFGS